MKKLIITFIFFATNLKAEILFFQNGRHSQQQIIIKDLDGVKVNDSCLLKKRQCLSFILKTPRKMVRKNQLIGNPGSLLCADKGGRSVILKDEKNNEYDYCVFSRNLFVNSWDMKIKVQK